MTLASTARITLDRLAGACDDQRVKFQEIFPNGFEATSEAECVAAARKHALAFDWWRASEILLTDPAGEAYEAAERSAWEAYKDATRSALEVYETAERSAREAYKDATRSEWGGYMSVDRPARESYEAAELSAMKAYEDATRSALEAYEAAARPALEAYEAACADAFARAFWAQESTQ